MSSIFSGLPMPLHVRPARPMTDEELMRFGSLNEMLDFERDAGGELHIWPIGGVAHSKRLVAINAELGLWSGRDGPGSVYLNSGWTLPDGSMRGADVAWVADAKTRDLTAKQREGFPPIVPDFVIELLRPDQSLSDRQHRMHEWMKNGVELAWILDPFEKAVHIYRQGSTPEVLTHISQVSGEGPVAGFVLPLDRIFR